jgi:hypothetical protein
MILATILAVCVVCSAPAPLLLVGVFSSPAQQQQDQPQDSSASQKANPPAQAGPPAPATPAATAPAKKQPGTGKRKRFPKKTASAPVNCPPVNTGANSAKPASSAPDASAGGGAAPTPPASGAGAPNPAPSGNAAAPANCPPAKTVIREGGTTEPAIQLIGGEGGEQASNQRATTDQLLGSTENNLKKVAGRQLTSSQQEMMTQIQQFMEQSKAAVAAGDLQRGHNLAMKARLLSDELVGP